MKPVIRALFLDIGGVLGTNGWDRPLRIKAAEKYGFDFDEMNERHHLTFDTYEEGKLTLDEYLKRVVFHEKCFFTFDEFKKFMFEGSKPYPEVIDFFRSLKSAFDLKIVAVSNEGRELNAHRIEKFGLNTLIDFYITSAYVHFRKPDVDIYKMALDVAQVRPDEIIYVDDRKMFVEVATALKINSIHHKNLVNTKAELSAFGLAVPNRVSPNISGTCSVEGSI
jgi:putative hydrolase of the HAD superfamily